MLPIYELHMVHMVYSIKKTSYFLLWKEYSASVKHTKLSLKTHGVGVPDAYNHLYLYSNFGQPFWKEAVTV